MACAAASLSACAACSSRVRLSAIWASSPCKSSCEGQGSRSLLAEKYDSCDWRKRGAPGLLRDQAPAGSPATPKTRRPLRCLGWQPAHRVSGDSDARMNAGDASIANQAAQGRHAHDQARACSRAGDSRPIPAPTLPQVTTTTNLDKSTGEDLMDRP